MNITELKEKLRDIVVIKFKEQYPEIFVICNTTDQEIYKSCSHGYKWYIGILNDIGYLDSRTYKIDGLTFYEKDYSDAYRMLEDAKNANDIIVWCFLNISHK